MTHGPGLVFRLFARTARVQRKRMGMTVMAIAWGTISIILLLSFGEGMKRSMNEGRRGLGTGIMVVWAGETSRAYAGFPAGRRIWTRPDDLDLIRGSIPEIAQMSGEMIRWGTQLTVGRKTLNKKVIGVQPEYGDMRAHFPEPGGRFIDRFDEELKRRVLFLGFTVKRELFGDEEAVGKTVLLNGAPFTVIGVMKEKRQMGMYGGPDENHAAMPFSTFLAIFGDPYNDDIVIRPRTPEQTELVERRVREVLASKYRFDAEDQRALNIWDVGESARQMNAMMLGIQIFLGIIGGLTLLIGGMGVANIMYAVVRQRTRTIGVQMALGARRVWVMGPIVLEAVVLTALGGAIGAPVGYGIVRAVAFVVSRSDSEALAFMGEPTFSLPIALATVLLLGMVGLLAGFFPSRKAATVQPAVALRFE
ncbi:MAG: ABC transporter permease [Candidatus Eisenbacteria bacterium]|nr:ABC transporter permease [Candidatus Eisenbacteria bacterium]